MPLTVNFHSDTFTLKHLLLALHLCKDNGSRCSVDILAPLTDMSKTPTLPPANSKHGTACTEAGAGTWKANFWSAGILALLTHYLGIPRSDKHIR